MSIFRKPKGTYTRATGDWFQAQRASAVGFHGHAGGAPEVWALYNNDTIGRSLHIYQMNIGTEVNGGIEIAFVQGQGGTPFTAPFGCFPINPSSPALPGVLSFNAFSLNPQNVIFQTEDVISSLDIGFSFDAPIWIVPPTWSIAISTNGIPQEMTVNIQYAVLYA